MPLQNFSSQSIAVNGTSINVLRTGTPDTFPTSTPTLVFLHYWGGSSRTWLPTIHHLATSFPCLAIDFRGFGQSSTTSSDLSIPTLASDVLAVLASLSITNYVLVGHSMGGKTAQLIATDRPDGLRGLVLVAPAPASPIHVPESQRLDMVHAYESPDSILAVLDGVLSHAPLSTELRAQVVEDSGRVSEDARRAWPERGLTYGFEDRVGAIAVPTLVVGAAEDRVDRVDVLKVEVLGRIEGAQLAVIEGSGHLIPLEAPGEVARLLMEFAGAQGW
ncbi:alpha/beta hydrolase protein [Blyttiomyces helicus]|uniref:Alpha/beta hydrolase protein n=1 Tax=Blyttiomyces helicus TaxID=388810 RepID=A0A4V1IQP1_9FUNG|nr:alpha/beta hydrolase protein [Blyttiomyces helicus]|eukprot:RKO87237.1 alpha/beta hydrolase protein [Blyttiomyces helicus]